MDRMDRIEGIEGMERIGEWGNFKIGNKGECRKYKE